MVNLFFPFEMETNRLRGVHRHCRSREARVRRAKKYFFRIKVLRFILCEFKRKKCSSSITDMNQLRDNMMVGNSPSRADKRADENNVANSAEKFHISSRVSVTWDDAIYDGVMFEPSWLETKAVWYKSLLAKYSRNRYSTPDYFIKYDDGVYSAVRLLEYNKLVDEDGDVHSFVRINAPTVRKFSSCHSLIGPKNYVNIGSFNVRSATTQSRLFRLVELAIFRKCDVIAVQEHRIRILEKDVSVSEKYLGDGWQFVYSSADDHGVGGVGFLFSPGAYKRFNGANMINNRLLVAHFSTAGKFPETVITSCYAPTNVQDAEIRISIFPRCQNFFRLYHRQRFLYVLEILMRGLVLLFLMIVSLQRVMLMVSCYWMLWSLSVFFQHYVLKQSVRTVNGHFNFQEVLRFK